MFYLFRYKFKQQIYIGLLLPLSGSNASVGQSVLRAAQIAFFEVPNASFEFKAQHDYDLHIALEVNSETLHRMLAKGKASGIETRGISDHEFIDSIYFRDPNGYVIELTAKRPDHNEVIGSEVKARRVLDQWTASLTTN